MDYRRRSEHLGELMQMLEEIHADTGPFTIDQNTVLKPEHEPPQPCRERRITANEAFSLYVVVYFIVIAA